LKDPSICIAYKISAAICRDYIERFLLKSAAETHLTLYSSAQRRPAPRIK